MRLDACRREGKEQIQSCCDASLKGSEFDKTEEAVSLGRHKDTPAIIKNRLQQANTEAKPSLRVPEASVCKNQISSMCSGRAGRAGRSTWITNPIRKKDSKRAELLKVRNAFEQVKRRLQEEAKRLEEERKMQKAAAEERETETSREEALSQKHKEALEIDERIKSRSVDIEQEHQIWVVGGDGIDGIGANAGLETKSEKLGMLMSGARIEEVHRCGNRLQYRKIDGVGPDMGWVHIRLNRKVALKRENKVRAGVLGGA